MTASHPSTRSARASAPPRALTGSEYPEVLANTVSAFALGDYEWLLAFEADDLVPIVDSCATCAPPRRAATRARSCRSSPVGAGRSPTRWPTCREAYRG
jgi:chlorite dismutase